MNKFIEENEKENICLLPVEMRWDEKKCELFSNLFVCSICVNLIKLNTHRCVHHFLIIGWERLSIVFPTVSIFTKRKRKKREEKNEEKCRCTQRQKVKTIYSRRETETEKRRRGDIITNWALLSFLFCLVLLLQTNQWDPFLEGYRYIFFLLFFIIIILD